MSGVKYHRLKQRLTKRALSKLSGVTESTIKRYEDPEYDPLKMQISKLRALAEVLHVQIDDLARKYDDESLSAGDHHTFSCRTLYNDNPIANYRRMENLTMKQMADRCGCSRQNISKACTGKGPSKKMIKKLCAYHDITLQTFDQRYGNGVSL